MANIFIISSVEIETKNCGFLKFLTSEILQSARNDPKLNQRMRHEKYPTYTAPRTLNPKFNRTTLHAAIFKTLHFLEFSHGLPC